MATRAGSEHQPDGTGAPAGALPRTVVFGIGAANRRRAMAHVDALRARGAAAYAQFAPGEGGWIVVVDGAIRQPTQPVARSPARAAGQPPGRGVDDAASARSGPEGKSDGQPGCSS